MANGIVLIADNDEGVGSLLRQVLEQSGIVCESVPDGVGALERLREGGVALLITDLDMPRLDGRTLLQEVASWEGPPQSLVVSGFIDQELERQLLALRGVVGVFRKPFDLLEFRDRVQSLLSGGKRG